LDTPPHLMTLASSASSLSLGTHHPLSCDTGQSSGALCHNTRTRCHRTRRRPMPQNAAGLFPPRRGTGCAAPVGSRETKRRAESTQLVRMHVQRVLASRSPKTPRRVRMEDKERQLLFSRHSPENQVKLLHSHETMCEREQIHSATHTNPVWNFPARNIERQDKYLRLLDRLSPSGLWLCYVCPSN
jgi:hypothetical protein